MEDSDELRWALKVVIKRQMRDLVSGLSVKEILFEIFEGSAPDKKG